MFSSSNRIGGASTTPGRSGEGDRGGRGGEEATGGIAAGVHFPSHWQEEEELEAKKKEEHRNRLVDAVACYQAEHLGLRSGRPMSQNNAIPPLSRPPSSQANAITAGNGLDSHLATTTDTGNNNADDGDARTSSGRTVQQIVQPVRVHDHNRPFPPPRLPPTATNNISGSGTGPGTGNVSSANVPSSNPRVAVTVPLSPLSNTFRTRPRNADASNETTTATTTTTTTTASPRGALLSSSANDTPPRSPIGEVSLTVPRPDGERTINEYVEAPFKHCCLNQERRRLDDEKRLATGDCPKIERRQHRQKGLVGSDGLVAGTHHRLQSIRNLQAFRVGSNVGTGSNATTGSSTANTGPIGNNTVTKQPVSFTKEPANSLASRTYDPAGLSIMCNFCGRCRCESCREPPPLPSKWLCDNKCFCSADTILDYASCLCCVKGLFYHCVDGSGPGGIDGEAAGSCADEPCSCTGNKKASRWACLGALTLLMPCLLCYWPFKGCVALCELCYARHAAQGCRCNPGNQGNSTAAGRHHPIASDIGDSRDPEKRLLEPVTPEL